MSNNSIRSFTFHKDEIGVSNGNTMTVNSNEAIMTLEANSVGTVTLVFEGMGTLGVWRPIYGVNLTTIDLVISTSDITPFYQFDLSGLTKIRIKILANSGSPTSVVGKIVG